MSDPEDGKEVFGGLPTIRGTMDEVRRPMSGVVSQSA